MVANVIRIHDANPSLTCLWSIFICSPQIARCLMSWFWLFWWITNEKVSGLIPHKIISLINKHWFFEFNNINKPKTNMYLKHKFSLFSKKGICYAILYFFNPPPPNVCAETVLASLFLPWFHPKSSLSFPDCLLLGNLWEFPRATRSAPPLPPVQLLPLGLFRLNPLIQFPLDTVLSQRPLARKLYFI
jgi:hypothetical protein